MLEKIEDCLNLLNALEENITKQPFFSAPTISEVLEQLAGFTSKGLDYLIRTLNEVKEEMEESA